MTAPSFARIALLLLSFNILAACTRSWAETASAAAEPLQSAVAKPNDQATTPPNQNWSYYALVIGNDNYQYLPKLQTATNDAKSVAHLLRDEYGFSTSLLLNATRSDILDALITYRLKLPANSSLVIYYAGHGTNDAEAKVAYWLPVDARISNTANWISADDITAELRVIKSTHVLVIADSCYSGALMRGLEDVDATADLKPEERLFYMEKLQQIKSRNVLASGGNEPVADGGGGGHSIFAAILLQSLRDPPAKQFTAGSLFQRVAVRVGGRSQQTPQYSAIVNSKHDGGDFIFLRQPGKTPPADLCCTVAAHPVESSGGGGAVSRSMDAPAADSFEEVINQFRSAYENEDVNELQRLWPTMKPDAVRSLQTFFRQAKSVQLRCTIVGTPVVKDTSATVSVLEDLSYTVDGKAKKMPPQKTTIKLRRPSGNENTQAWEIESIK